VSSKYHPHGEPVSVGEFTVQEECTPGLTKNRFRLIMHTGTNLLLSENQMFDLADVLDTMCDQVDAAS
jgi:hypothetical protein